MERIAKFEKVPYEVFEKSVMDNYPLYKKSQIRELYDNIQLPTRATKGSAGYDIHSTVDAFIDPNAPALIPTGICVTMQPGWFLQILPRSGYGFKYGIALANTAGIIDEDFINSDTHGHIMLKMITHYSNIVGVNAGDKIAQGIFVQYGITTDDIADGERTGGFGSTGK